MKKILILVSLTLFLSLAVYAASDYYRLNKGLNEKLDLHNNCKKVENTGIKDIFIPTKTSGEWSSFLNNAPNEIVLNDCCDFCPLGFNYNSLNKKCEKIDIINKYEGDYVVNKGGNVCSPSTSFNCTSGDCNYINSNTFNESKLDLSYWNLIGRKSGCIYNPFRYKSYYFDNYYYKGENCPSSHPTDNGDGTCSKIIEVAPSCNEVICGDYYGEKGYIHYGSNYTYASRIGNLDYYNLGTKGVSNEIIIIFNDNYDLNYISSKYGMTYEEIVTGYYLFNTGKDPKFTFPLVNCLKNETSVKIVDPSFHSSYSY